jgi:hypothetical protein
MPLDLDVILAGYRRDYPQMSLTGSGGGGTNLWGAIAGG